MFLAARGPGYAVFADHLAGLETRLLEGRFHLAVLGQVKRGKSTLINALLGEDVLPSSVVPLTAIPTFIRYGTEKGIRVRYNDRRPDAVFTGEPALRLNALLRGFVTEEENPRNQKGVLHVEITHPAPVLRDVVLIDTPGIGSTYRHNTEATMNFLPQCDAALFLVSADPPITEVEVAFLKEIKNRVAKLFFVLNKIDYLNEADRGTAFAFYRSVLTRDAGIDAGTRIFAVSAKEGLQARESGDTRGWLESGLAEVFDHLIAFLAHEKSQVLKEAIGRKAFDVFTGAGLRISLEIRALDLPLAELESRLALFDKKIAEAQQQRIHAQDILAGDRKRVHAHLEEHIEKCRAPLREHLTKVAEAAIAASPQDPEHAAQRAVSAEIPGWFEREYGRISAMTDQEVTVLLRDHRERADELIESIRKAASELFEIPYHAPGGERAYEQVRTPYWVEHDWDSTFSIIPAGIVGRILPVSLRAGRARGRLKKQIDILVMRNLENLRWETLQNIDAAFRKFGADLDTNLGLTIDATHGAIESALTRRTHHKEDITATINDLHAASVYTEKIIQQFCFNQE
jgi:small GTP-binding protein